MAAALAGSYDDVRASMQCAASDFLAYVDGQKEPPPAERDRLVSLIVREQNTLIAKNRQLIARIRNKGPKQ